MGNRLIYRDTFDEALSEITGGGERPARLQPTSLTSAPEPTPSPPRSQDQRSRQLADRLRRLREQAQQLVKDIQAVESEAQAP
jgi:hypothetical protein